ncbi:hypothetical protein GNI_079050 [Gregarina niphandrodes]|uniref:Uncharacterized protein n=1 Tax=Gregarina niphandrodes TaxID=110365 RepID=A0A023B6L0_GRENI|nr:hypothetical protein GNI_079050 [Gregarina niphandrodes]EZG66586.1 hypothetical protein GNI_079050 [Gregarina niphandrodes]|eukprot:XP_011130595.1 hypothetical protein GNI_079050 [Gregarina niphandrodes]
MPQDRTSVDKAKSLNSLAHDNLQRQLQVNQKRNDKRRVRQAGGDGHTRIDAEAARADVAACEEDTPSDE